MCPPLHSGMGLYTIGHSTRPLPEFIELLHAHGISRVIDVRRFPGSRRYPQYGQVQLQSGLEVEGIGYVHVEALGGRRSTNAESTNTAWRNASFRAYADYMATPEFRRALDELLARAADEDVAVMCAEAVPWRCHRNLIADAAVARGVDVRHITGPSAPSRHKLSRHGVVRADGTVSYPAPTAAQTDLLGDPAAGEQ